MMLPTSLLLLLLPSLLSAHQIPEIIAHPKRTEGGLHVPIYRRQAPASSLKRRAGTETSSIGLGNFDDITYNILVSMDGTLVPLVLDTGSSDLWTVTDSCQSAACRNTNVPVYPQATFQSAHLDVNLFYGDSTSGTHAFGEVGKDTVGVAGLSLTNQFFGAINNTDSSALNTSAAGIVGFGFPVNSVIWAELFKAQFPNDIQPPLKRANAKFPDIKALMGGARAKMQREITRGAHYLPDFRRKPFPDLASLLPPKSKSTSKRQSASKASLIDLLGSFITNGPIISRLAQTALAAPQFTVSLQRDTFDIGSGNQGMLSLGELPEGLTNDSFTWVPIRHYTAQQGGIDSPTDTYPIAWEVPIDNVFIDGQVLPTSTLSPNVTVTALIDTGNSIVRGPKDVVNTLMNTISASKVGNVDCATPHVMSFQIGGKIFPVDPRDFVSGGRGTKNCAVNVVSTDPPSTGFLYSWSLGDTFLKSNIVTFYYGNLTHPSQDPPRMGFMSTVPANATTRYTNALSAAQSIGGFPSRVESAPPSNPSFATTISNIPVSTSGVDRSSTGSSTGNGSPSTGGGQQSGAMRLSLPGVGASLAVGIMGIVFGMGI